MKPRVAKRDPATAPDRVIDLGQSPLAAYRDGLAGRPWEPPSPFVAACIGVAAILRAASTMPDGARRRKMVRKVADMLRDASGPSQFLEGRGDYPGDTSPDSVIRGAAEYLESGSESHYPLAAHLLESAHALYPELSVEGGRFLSALGRNALVSGREDLGRDRAIKMLLIGRATRHPEILSHAWLAVASAGNVAGNFPMVERAARRLRKYAELSGNPRLMCAALDTLTTTLGRRGDYAGAVELGWRALPLATHPLRRASLLANIAETFYRTGQFAASRAARAVVVRTSPDPGIACISLGGYAASCAPMGDLDGVRWAVAQCVAIADTLRGSRGIAQGLLGCGDACGEVGWDALALTLHQRGMEMADKRGYHDLRFRADPRTRKKVQHTIVAFEGVAEEVRKSILDLAPDGIAAGAILVAG
jgi:hypothetical protein